MNEWLMLAGGLYGAFLMIVSFILFCAFVVGSRADRNFPTTPEGVAALKGRFR